MKKVFFLLIPLVFIAGTNDRPKKMIGQKDSDNGINILLLVNNPYGANYFLNRDVFEQYGWNLTHAAVSETAGFCWQPASRTFFMKPDILIKDIKDVTKYDCIANT